ncbi:hypothetical protein FNO01nite_26700 [Flavobacterium noncentrifugens]|uniref:AraC-type DNA-binding protein n=1 Tax=Flavobacterium noncentrifugens TaxID=1128970 RepID=A0A1G9CDL7_9FLAO|nr:AraC family transcriptional regulator [Flavobacterium noncentrifugens]GEP51998.1 hypothetical protein FNO01nite_26700 [Flavobacterium noncentrifugens]SDK49742.1 AraC-type DNA-binding protein [Flavobacterium noncentrifugens]
MNFNIFNSIILAGIFQGIVFAMVVLFSKKYNIFKSTLLLAGIILSFSLSNLGYYLRDINLITAMQFYEYCYVPFPLLIPVLLYFYVGAFLDPQKKTKLREKFLYVPFAIFLLPCIAFKIAKLSGFQNDTFYRSIYYVPFEVEILGILMMMVTMLYCIIKINRFERSNDKNIINSTNSGLRWLKWTCGGLIFLTTVWSYQMIKIQIDGMTSAFYLLWIGISIMIYWLGHIGIYKFGIQQQRKKIRNYSIESKISYVPEKQKSDYIVTFEKMFIGEKRFLDPTITLDKIADELHLSKSYLSRIINGELGSSFPDYLNALRVEEAKSYLSNADFSNYTLVAIGLEAGFNSKTTFNNTFKKVTGITPSDFKNGLR